MSAALLSLFSCTKEVSEQEEPLVCDSFTACIYDEVNSKAFLDPNNELKWNAADEISVFSNSENRKYVFDGNDEDNTGTFSLSSGTPAPASFSKYYAVYPYAESTACASEGSISYTFPSVQHYNGGYFDGYLMVAVTSSLDDRNLKFRNVGSFLKIRLYNSLASAVSKITVSGNNGETLAGNAKISVSQDKMPSVEFTSSVKSIVLDCGSDGVALGTTAATATEFLVMLPPVNFTKGITITVEDTQGVSYQKNSSLAFSLSRNDLQGVAAIPADFSNLYINGTKILEGNNLCGLITDKSTGKAMPGVAVTDCFSTVRTDENGVYQFKAYKKAFSVSYNLPAGYKYPLKNGNMPDFYANDLDLSKVNRRDFQLVPDDNTSNEFAFAVIGDVHIGASPGDGKSGATFSTTQCDRLRNGLLANICKTFDDGVASGKYPERVFMTSIGDITNDGSTTYYDKYYNACKGGTQRGDGSYLPFYQVIGNHDHTQATPSTHDEHFQLRKNHIDRFGPVNYSMDIGNAHLIFMDNAPWSDYTEMYVEDKNWALSDLANVSNKSSKIVLLFCHVPFRGGAKYDRSGSMGGANKEALFAELCKFNEAHVFTGHTHRTQNWVNKSLTTVNGNPIIEHIHGMAGGHYWGTKICPDGTPNGSTIYTIRGNVMTEAQLNPMHYNTDYQMRVYNGNTAITHGTGKFYWYNATNTCNNTSNIKSANGNSNFKDAFVLTVWNSDIQNWKFEFWQNGSKVGNFSRPCATAETNPSLTGAVCDVFTAGWFDGSLHNKPNDDTVRKDTQHYFYFKAPGGNPATEENWEVRAVHQINEGPKHVYKCTSFTTSTSDFTWDWN